ncbi:short chain dehydrogenase/oxidoreductase CpoX2 [Penicillium cf. viridicatum]|uniref:Short chain dehydrogenase/oxidoreductase CpoX2 n=1 Tax=Penicillium cf. viridicatum TaxID=2972119 RepID=A0A9W9T9G2_9EURO|nr:short chain dehydrogenase/oxidoreductase CpoX2 [Penicillium cf. viridicatum]
MVSISSKIFAITGGASGIGAATARLLAKKGAKAIWIGDLGSNNFSVIKKTLSGINSSTEVHCTALDVTSSREVNKWTQEIISICGDIHGAANCAGIPQATGVRSAPTILEETDKAWKKILEVNLDGIFYCTRSQVQAMKDLKPMDRSIVNIASIASMVHTPDMYAYSVSKASCAFFTQSVAKDAYPFGIRINVVSPGATSTPMLNKFIPTAKNAEELEAA